MSKLKPMGDRVLVRREKAAEKSAGGIFIPDTAREAPQHAVVVAVGPGARREDGGRIEPRVKDGDRVLLAKWSGTEVEMDSEKMLVVREDDILAVIEE